MTMAQVRAAIDRIDDELVKLIAERQIWVEKAIEVKSREGLAARIPERIGEVLERTARQAKTRGADPGLVRLLWTEMIEWFIGFEERRLTK
jgi:isochorismate pyruvate lyase